MSARAHLASLCDHAAARLEPVLIRRRGAEDVALVSAAELWSPEARGMCPELAPARRLAGTR